MLYLKGGLASVARKGQIPLLFKKYIQRSINPRIRTDCGL